MSARVRRTGHQGVRSRWDDRRVTAPRRPGLLTDLGAAVLALVLVGIAGWLGLWQYDAWQAHRDAEARDLSQLAPVPLTDVMGSDDPFPAPDLGRPVEVSGDWLDGRVLGRRPELAGEAGYWAVAPLKVGDAAVLVVRGWAEEPDPALLAATGSADVTGWLQAPEGSMATDDDPDDDVFPEIRVADAVQRVDVDLYAAYVVGQEPARRAAGRRARGAPEPEPLHRRCATCSTPSSGGSSAAFAAFIWWRWRRDVARGPRRPSTEASAG